MKNAKFGRLKVWVVLSAVLLGGAGARAGVIWTAYNDCIRDPGDSTAANATEWTIYQGYTSRTTGKLKDFALGSELDMPTVTFTMQLTSPVKSRADYGDNFAAGTEAHAAFDGKVDFSGMILQHSSLVGWWVEIRFTNLDPTKTYNFIGSAVRISPADMSRRSLFTILDAESYVNNSGYHSVEGDAGWVGDSTTKFLAVGNATEGVVIRWDDIEPGPDGDFAIRAEADSDAGSHGRQGYPFGGFMLEQIGIAGNRAPVVGAGVDQETTLPDNRVDLDGTVADDGLGDPNGFLEIRWSKISGPGEVRFEPDASTPNAAAILEPLQAGAYVLRLWATDGAAETSDDVRIIVRESICPTGDLSGNCIVNAEDVGILADAWLDDPVDIGDIEGDNDVDMGDFAWLAKSWGENRQRGSVQVGISPQAALDADAQWRVDGGTWRNSGYTQGDLTVGPHTVEFKTVAGWDTPANEQVQVEYAQTASASGTYVQQKGMLRATISPQAAIDGGAQWRIDGGPWLDSGDTLGDLTVGVHTVEYKVVSGWIKPANQDVQVNKDQTAETSGVYEELPDTSVMISEFMAVNSYVPFISNLNIYTEVYGHDTNPDWIELHNIDPSNTIDLEGWYLTNDPEDLTKWRFPGRVRISPDRYFVLFASSKKQAENPGNYPFVDGDGMLHTNFALGRGGGFLALVKPDGISIAHAYGPKYPGQRGFVSYGISNTGETGYLLSPTPGSRSSSKWPGAANTGKYVDAVADTRFSRDRGFYDAPFSVIITCNTPGATIRYTTNGSEPTLSNGSTATGPIQITTTTPLRAAAFRTGWLPTNVDTQTYIFPADVVVQSQAQAAAAGYPTSSTAWNGYPGDYEMDPQVYNDAAYSPFMIDAMLSIPTLSVVTHKDHLFGGSGIYLNTGSRGLNWERPVSAEFFDVNGVKEFQVNCGLRLQGGASRNAKKAPKHSLSLRFRGGYGPGQLEFDLFEGSRVDRHNSLQLRAMYNNSWIHWDNGQRRRGSMIRDQWIRDCLLDMGQRSGGHGTYVHLYLNGFYWGVYNVHERPEASHYSSYYDIDEDKLDALNSGSAIDGTGASWNNLHNMVANAVSGGISLAEHRQIAERLDLVNLADYFIVNHYGANRDWDNHNWRAAGGGVANATWRIFSWDAERILEGVGDNKTGQNSSGDPSRLFQNMRNSAEFKLLFADRLHKHYFNNGAMTPSQTAARWMRRAAELDLAIIGESARWGDYRRDMHSSSNGPYEFYRKNSHWLPEQSRLLSSYFPARTTNSLNQYKGMGLYPSLAAPRFNRHGGWYLNGFNLTMSGSGTIYYTLNGEDPRLPGGAVNAAEAEVYSGTINLTGSALVKARARSGSTWSALNEAVFAVGPVAENLRITEIMYNPKDTGDPDDPNEEFIELRNIGPETINLNLVSFTNGVDFAFPSLELAENEYVVVVRNAAAFAAAYPGFSGVFAGEYAGSLNNGGERIELEDALGVTIHNFRYNDGWFEITDGKGFSLTLKDPDSTDPNDWDRKSGWRTSSSAGGSPGWDDSGEIPAPGTIIINEVLAHSHDEAPDWIELHNTGSETIDIGGWFLSDSDANLPALMKYEIAEGTLIDPCGYIVFYQDPNFGVLSDPGTHQTFALSENGETVFLHVGRGGELLGLMYEEDFGASATGVPFGQYRLSTGKDKFVPMSSGTPGWANAYPKVGPVVITEIMYHPTDPTAQELQLTFDDDDDFEYIELYNITDLPVTLEGWDNVKGIFVPWWVRGIDFTFAPSTTIPAHSFLILARKPAAFTYRYGALPAGVQLIDYDDGKLDNGGERLELAMPGDERFNTPEIGDYYPIRVDRVEYDDAAPWPVDPNPDGGGYSLSRIWANLHGDDPNNWTATLPSPGE